MIRLPRRNAPDLVLQGATLLAEATSHTPHSRRWAELRVWQTDKGKLVAEQVGRTIIQGEDDRRNARVCKTPEQVRRWLGYGWLATVLYERLGWNTNQDPHEIVE